jgi:hypothetical protein
VRARPRVQLRNVGYESNIFYAPEGSDRVQGDLVATIAPGLGGLLLLGERGWIDFDAELRYKAYAQFYELNYLDRLGSAEVTIPIGRFGVVGGLRATRIRLHPRDLDDIRTEQKFNEVTLGAVFKTGARSHLTYRRVRQDFRYSDSDFSFTPELNVVGLRLDREETGNRLDFTQRVGGRTTLGLTLSNRAIRFDTPSLIVEDPDGTPVQGPNRDAREIRLVPAVHLDVGGPLVGTLAVGWAELVHVVESPILPDYSGAVGEAALTYLFSKRTRLTLRGERSVDFSLWQENSYYVFTDAGLEGVYYFNAFMGADAGASVGRLDIPGGTTPRVDDITAGFVGVRFRMMRNDMGRRVEYAVRLRRTQRESNLPRFNRTYGWFTIDAIFGF